MIGAVAYSRRSRLRRAGGRLGRGRGLLVLTFAGLAWFLNRNRHLDPRDPVGSRATPPDEHRMSSSSRTRRWRDGKLHEAVRRAVVGRPAQVLVVSPALNSPLRHFVSDEGNARREAQERLNRSLEALANAGLDARGEVGDADPLQAIEDALRTFGADVIIISTHPEGRSNWLERGVVSGARERFAVPIEHVVVDLDRAAV